MMYPESDVAAALAAFNDIGNKRSAAAHLGWSESRLYRVLKQAAAGVAANTSSRVPYAPPLPDDDIPTEEIINLMKRRFNHRHENAKAKRWREFTAPTDGPYALMLFGDPHVDDDGCNWNLLEDHCELARKTDDLYAISIGDVTNNWGGRLEKLYANQETSAATGRKLVKRLLQDSGVPWWIWVHGNHDAWNGGIALIEEMNIHRVVMEDWQT